MIKVSKNFYLWEFVTPEIWRKYGKNSIWFVDPFCWLFCEYLRGYYKRPVFVNTYGFANTSLLGVIYNDSGVRDENSKRRMGEKFKHQSLHVFGKASDCKIPGVLSEDIRNHIRENFTEINEKTGLTTIERGTEGWVHGDCRYTGLKTLFEVEG